MGVLSTTSTKFCLFNNYIMLIQFTFTLKHTQTKKPGRKHARKHLEQRQRTITARRSPTPAPPWGQANHVNTSISSQTKSTTGSQSPTTNKCYSTNNNFFSNGTTWNPQNWSRKPAVFHGAPPPCRCTKLATSSSMSITHWV